LRRNINVLLQLWMPLLQGAVSLASGWREVSFELFREIVVATRETGMHNRRELYRHAWGQPLNWQDIAENITITVIFNSGEETRIMQTVIAALPLYISLPVVIISIVFAIVLVILMRDSILMRVEIDRFKRFVAESKLRQQELNQEQRSPDGKILGFRQHYYFLTIVEAREKFRIENYCKERGIDTGEFLARLAMDDVRSGPKSLIEDEFVLALGKDSDEPPPRPKAVEDVIKENAIRAESLTRMLEEWEEERVIKREEWGALYFPLSKEQYDLVSRHVQRGKLTVRYHGRLAVEAIQKAHDAEIRAKVVG
jgi:hypothetical protein